MDVSHVSTRQIRPLHPSLEHDQRKLSLYSNGCLIEGFDHQFICGNRPDIDEAIEGVLGECCGVKPIVYFKTKIEGPVSEREFREIDSARRRGGGAADEV